MVRREKWQGGMSLGDGDGNDVTKENRVTTHKAKEGKLKNQFWTH